MRIAIDMDEVMADAVKKIRACYENEFGIHLTDHDLAGKHLSKIVPPDHAQLVKKWLHTKGFFRDFEVIEGSQAAIKQLTDAGHDIFITTAAMEFKYCLEDKYEWLEEHFPFLTWHQMVFCGSKKILNADYLVDDNPINFDGFVGQGLLYTAHHNLNETRFPRVNNWAEVLEALGMNTK